MQSLIKFSKLFFLFQLLGFQGLGQEDGTSQFRFFSTGLLGKDTMTIATKYTECGEWGGHLEEIKIFMRSGICVGEFRKYSGDCNAVKRNDDIPTQSIILRSVTQLDHAIQLLLLDYLQSLIRLKFIETDYGNTFVVNEVKLRTEMSLFVTGRSADVAVKYNKLVMALTK